MVETAIFSQWMHRENLDLKYARWKMGRAEGEVDIVLLDNKLFKPQWCIEIKWSNRYAEKPQELGSLIYFCKQNNFKATLETTIEKSEKKGNKLRLKLPGVGFINTPNGYQLLLTVVYQIKTTF